jgi:hypothetical protein
MSINIIISQDKKVKFNKDLDEYRIIDQEDSKSNQSPKSILKTSRSNSPDKLVQLEDNIFQLRETVQAQVSTIKQQYDKMEKIKKILGITASKPEGKELKYKDDMEDVIQKIKKLLKD